MAGCQEYLRVIAGIIASSKILMSSDELQKVECLRGLHAPQTVSVNRPFELVVAQLHHRIDAGQHRDGGGRGFQLIEKTVDHHIGDKGPRRIMDENISGAPVLPDRQQSVVNRLLAGGTADHDLVGDKGAKSLV